MRSTEIVRRICREIRPDPSVLGGGDRFAPPRRSHFGPEDFEAPYLQSIDTFLQVLTAKWKADGRKLGEAYVIC